MAYKTPGITSEYIRGLLGGEKDEFLAGILRDADERRIPVLLPEAAAFLRQLIMLKKPEKVLEIGTATGYSGCVILGACDTVKLLTIEKNPEYASAAKFNFRQAGFAERAEVLTGDAADLLAVLSGEFDAIFLDGPKAQYSSYFKHLKHLLNPGGILICDNVLFNGMVAGANSTDGKYKKIVEKLQEFLCRLTADEDFVTSILEVGDGISLSILR